MYLFNFTCSCAQLITGQTEPACNVDSESSMKAAQDQRQHHHDTCCAPAPGELANTCLAPDGYRITSVLSKNGNTLYLETASADWCTGNAQSILN